MPRWDEHGNPIQTEERPRVRRWDADGNEITEAAQAVQPVGATIGAIAGRPLTGEQNARARATEQERPAPGFPLERALPGWRFALAVARPLMLTGAERQRVGANVGAFARDYERQRDESLALRRRRASEAGEYLQGALTGRGPARQQTLAAARRVPGQVSGAVRSVPGQVSRAAAAASSAVEAAPEAMAQGGRSALRRLLANPIGREAVGIAPLALAAPPLALAAAPFLPNTRAAATEAAPHVLPMAGALGRELTFGPGADVRDLRREQRIEQRMRQAGYGTPGQLEELADESLERVGAHGLNVAFAPADAALVAKGAAQLASRLPRLAPRGARPPLRGGALRGPARRAVSIIERRMQQGGVTIDDIDATARGLRRQGGGTAETIAEVGGKPLQNAARAVANVEGPGQAIANTYLSERAAGMGERIMREVTRAAAPQQTRAPRDYWDAMDALRTARTGQAAEGYQALYGYGKGSTAQAYETAVQQRLLPYLQQAPPEAAVSGARQLATEAGGLRAELARAQQRGAAPKEITALQAELDDVALSQRQLEGLASGQAPNSVTTRAVDYFQRGLSQMERAAGMGSPEARALGNARRAFNGMADDLIPPFNDVRTRYAAAERIQEFMDQGRRVFTMPEGEVSLLLRGQGGKGLSMEEFDGFMLGVMDALQTKIDAGDGRFVAQFMRNKNWQSQLERAFTPPPAQARRAIEANRRRGRAGRDDPIPVQEVQAQQARMATAATKRLHNRIAREANERDFDNAVRAGSRTTPMAQDIKGLTTGEDGMGFVGEIIEGGGNVKMWGIRQLARIWDRLHRPGIYNPEVNRELATRLFQPATTGNVAKLREELAALRRSGARLPSGVERDLVNVANRIGAAGGRSTQRQSSGPPRLRGAPAKSRHLPRRPPGGPPRAMGALLTGGAIGAGALLTPPGEAQAQEGSPQLEEARAEVERLQGGQRLLRQASQTHAEADVLRAQQFLQGEGFYDYETDGDWGDITRDAIRDFNNGPHFAEAQRQLATLERDEVARRNSAGPAHQAAREFLPTALGLGMYALGHRSRSGSVRAATGKMEERNRQAEALAQTMGARPPITPPRSNVARRELDARVADVNRMWELGGAGQRVPYVTASTPSGFRRRPRALEEAALFAPPRTLLGQGPKDAMIVGAATAEGVGATVGVHYAQREVDAARAEVAEHPDSEDARKRLETALDILALAQSAQRAGFGFAAGRFGGAAFHPYQNQRPDIRATTQEQNALNRYLATRRKK